MKPLTVGGWVLFCLTIFFNTSALATPPVSISLTYDMDKGSLHVEAIHPSFNLEKSYVRLMNVYVNGTQVATQNYYRQDDYNKFSDDVSLTAKVGDVIRVDLFCTLGGEMAKELAIKNPGVSQTDQDADSDNAAGDSSGQN